MATKSKTETNMLLIGGVVAFFLSILGHFVVLFRQKQKK